MMIKELPLPMTKGTFDYVRRVQDALPEIPALGRLHLTIWVLLLILWRSSTMHCAVNAFTFHSKKLGLGTKRSANPLVLKPKRENPANLRKTIIGLLDTIISDTNSSENFQKDFLGSNPTTDQNRLLDGRDRLDLNNSSKEDWNDKLHQHSFIRRNVPSFHVTLPYQSAASKDVENESSILISFPALWSMCRPNNFIGILMLHTLGTYLAINKSNTDLLKILFHPQQIAVLLSLLLTSATSMMVNDYYDIRSGVDSHKVGKPKASPRVMKRVLGLLYAPLLLITAVVPGISARLLVLSGAMLTFLYTEHLKPVTWVKTITCALLIAISPLTSGLAALSLGVFPLSNTVFNFSVDDSLLRLVAMLLCGFFGREILMDMNDMLQDQRHGIQTVPVRYGVQFAARVALLSTLLMSLICLQGTTNRRQFVLGFSGSILQTIRSIQVLWSNGSCNDAITTAVEEGKLTVLLLLASYV